jgi:predicted DNA-binding ribbon-helix-helix protein
MRTKVLRLELEDNLYRELEEVAARLGLGTIEDALRIAAADWLARRKAEIDDRDPTQRYFVNEALDELIARKR